MSENKEKNYETEHRLTGTGSFDEEVGKSYPRVGESVRKHRHKYALISFFVALLIAVGGVSAAAVANDAPYAITIKGEPVCFVEGKNEAEAVFKKIVEEFAPEGSDIKAIATGDLLNIEPADDTQKAKDNALNVKKAVSNVKDAISDADDGAEITVVSTGTEIKKFTPKTKYIKDDTMLAGETVVEVKAKKGSKELFKRYTTVNGEVKDEEVLEETIIKKGTAAKIRKGTLGLPEGEDWKTYEGLPVYNNGEELTQTALQYLGAPYKYGGKSLVTGIDCVQFIRQMYAKYGIYLPNGKNALKHVGVSVPYANARPGDIICYAHHYAIYLGNGRIVHATSKGGVRTRDNANFQKIVTVRRIVG